MAPTPREIEALLAKKSLHHHVKSDSPGSMLNFGGLEDIFDENVHVSIPGLDVDIHGVAALDGDDVHPNVPALTDIIDTEKPISAPPPHVIGGGDDSHAVIIATSKATTKSGQPWDHDTVALIHFNESNKIDSVKLYIDTKHVIDHHNAHGV